MNSPETPDIIHHIKIYKEEKTPIYLQIAEQIIKLIQQGILTKNTLLPSSRQLSTELKINRNTAVAVYNELDFQGWVSIIKNKGTFVSDKFHNQKLKTQKSYPNQTNFPFLDNSILTPPFENIDTAYAFNDGITDIRLHNNKEYNRWYNAVLQKSSLQNKWNTYLNDRSIFLNTQLSNYVNITRNINIKPENILATSSIEMSLYLITQLLINPNDVVLVGELSNFAANMVFSKAQASIKTIPIDKDGLNIDYIRDHFSRGEIRFVYCNTNRHYPTTVSLSTKRKKELLQLADEYHFAIIEDDFDNDLQFNISTNKPLIKDDSLGSVIYLSKVGDLLFPALETSFIIAPKNFISQAKNYYQMINRQGDLIKEQMLAELLYEGELNRQLNKKKIIYNQRCNAMINALHNYFGNRISIKKPNGGLALFIEFKKNIPLLKLSTEIKKYNVSLPKHLLYQTNKICGIRIGYGNLTIDEIDFTIKMLRNAYDDLSR